METDLCKYIQKQWDRKENTGFWSDTNIQTVWGVPFLSLGVFILKVGIIASILQCLL